jgi:hypothetical protein
MLVNVWPASTENFQVLTNYFSTPTFSLPIAVLGPTSGTTSFPTTGTKQFEIREPSPRFIA